MSQIQTKMVMVDPARPDPDALNQAAALILLGELVAFPTETVYGLGANALDTQAAAGIFRAKGRPSKNPLIVHVDSIERAKSLTSSWPKTADQLAAIFWPGPLTLILPKSNTVPDIVTAGGPTIAVRMPAHPIALGLIRAADVPIAAPSANRSEQLSPTLAEHVLEGLNGRISMILDGGATSGGVESTVLDLTTGIPKILRPGLITPGEIEAVIGTIQRLSSEPADENNSALPSPGMMSRHYAPRARLEISTIDSGDRVRELVGMGEKVGWLTLDHSSIAVQGCHLLTMPTVAAEYAHEFYAVLHELDRHCCTVIIVDAPPAGEDWDAIRDRMSRAATIKEKVIN